MKLTTEDLESLAKIYRATTTQIQTAPDAAELVSRMDRAQKILTGLTHEDLERWLSIGESLARK